MGGAWVATHCLLPGVISGLQWHCGDVDDTCSEMFLCLKAFVSFSYFNYESIDVRLAADVYIYYKLRLTLCGVTKHWSYFSSRLLFLTLLCEIDL